MKEHPTPGNPASRLTTVPDTPAWLDESLYPFRRSYLRVDGQTIHYVDEGEGPPVVFLHGVGVWSFTYRHLIGKLRDRFRCIAIDLPGYGFSPEAPGFTPGLEAYTGIVAAFIEALGLRDLTLFGHDTGGTIGLGAVVRLPERFRAIALLDTFAFPLGGLPQVSRMIKFVSSDFPGAFLVERLNMMVRAVEFAGMKLRKLSPRERAAFFGPFPTAASRRKMRTLFADVLRQDGYLAQLQRRLAGLKIPALLMPSEKSGAVEVLLPGLQSTFSDHHTVVLQGAGHFSAEDAPDQIIAAFLPWWDGKVKHLAAR